MTDAVNGRLWPPLNITLPVTMVPGTAAAPTVAVQTAWAPTGMTSWAAAGPLWIVHDGTATLPATSTIDNFASTGPGLINTSLSSPLLVDNSADTPQASAGRR